MTATMPGKNLRFLASFFQFFFGFSVQRRQESGQSVSE